MLGYRYILDETVVEAMASRSEDEQRAWLQVFRHLAANPFLRGELQTRDSVGRVVESIVIGDFVVSVVSDHAVKEVRIVEVI